MKMSEKKEEIFKALNEFRNKLKQPVKNATNPFFKKKYVPLENVVEVIDKAIEGTGLSYLQEATSEENTVSVSTSIFHESGEYILLDKLTLPVERVDAQKIGSAITYAKRYSLSAAFGITSDEDDDGQAAADIPNQNQQRPSHKKQSNQQPPQQITGRQLADLRDEARKVADVSGLEPDVFVNKLAEMGNVQTVEELQSADFAAARAELVKWKHAYQKKQEKQNQTELFNSKNPPMAKENTTIPWGQKQ